MGIADSEVQIREDPTPSEPEVTPVEDPVINEETPTEPEVTPQTPEETPAVTPSQPEVNPTTPETKPETPVVTPGNSEVSTETTAPKVDTDDKKAEDEIPVVTGKILLCEFKSRNIFVVSENALFIAKLSIKKKYKKIISTHLT